MSLLKSGLNDLKDETEQMSKDEKRIEQPDKVVDIVEAILEFNNLCR